MPSLLEAAEAFSKLGKKSVEIEQAACVRVRHRHATCDACFQACAHDAITLNEGLLAIDNHLCTGCGACMSICPTGALQLVDDVFGLVQAAIDEIVERAEALPQGGEELGQAESVRDDRGQAGVRRGQGREKGVHRGQSCGVLNISCEYLHNQQAALKEQVTEEGLHTEDALEAAVSLEDGTGREPEQSLTIGCLAALDEAALVTAACSNVEVHYESGDCAHCPNAQGELIAALGENATRFFSAFMDATSADGLLAAAPKLPTSWAIDAPDDGRGTANTSPEFSRRGLFDHFIERTTDSIAEAAVSTFYVGKAAQDQKQTLAQTLLADKGILKRIRSVRNERVLNELYRLDPEWAEQILPEDDATMLPTRLFGEVRVDEDACNLCGICMTFCPTGALGGIASEPVNSFLALKRNVTPTGELTFRANDCMACNLCVDVCPHHALEVQRGISEHDLFAFEPRTLIKR